MKRFLFLLSLLPLIAGAQEATEKPEPPQPEPETTSRTPGQGTSTDEIDAFNKVFKPSEEVSADEGIKLPVDI